MERKCLPLKVLTWWVFLNLISVVHIWHKFSATGCTKEPPVGGLTLTKYTIHPKLRNTLMHGSCLYNVKSLRFERTTYTWLLLNKHINWPIISSFSRFNRSIYQQSFPSATFYIHDIVCVNLSCILLHYCALVVNVQSNNWYNVS